MTVPIFDHSVVVPGVGHSSTLAECRAALDAVAPGAGGDVTFVRDWLHPALGMTHDCAGHSEADALPSCYQASAVVVAVLSGLPRPWGPEVVVS